MARDKPRPSEPKGAPESDAGALSAWRLEAALDTGPLPDAVLEIAQKFPRAQLGASLRARNDDVRAASSREQLEAARVLLEMAEACADLSTSATASERQLHLKRAVFFSRAGELPRPRSEELFQHRPLARAYIPAGPALGMRHSHASAHASRHARPPPSSATRPGCGGQPRREQTPV
jgi:hypothetical protein